jgi:hypothetical protein
MARRYIGDAVVDVRYVASADCYAGTVSVGDTRWTFGGLHAPRIQVAPAVAADSPTMYDRMAASAVSFGSYYTSHNRGDDCPDWAPPAAVADAIDGAVSFVQDDQGRYAVRRSPEGKERWEE